MMSEKQVRHLLKKDPAKREFELRNFGKLVGGVFGILGVLGILRLKMWGLPFYAIGIVLVGFGVLRPLKLDWVERKWMFFAGKLGRVMTVVLLVLTYFVVILPTGLFQRIRGKDLLGLKFDRKANSYWLPVEADGPGSRPDQPY